MKTRKYARIKYMRKICMRTLNFKEIINLSVDEIISIKKAEVKEIEDYLLQDDVSEFGRESFLVHIESIKNEFNVLINL